MTETISLPRRGHITHDPLYQCAVEGCPLRYRAAGLCETHYRQRLRRDAAFADWADQLLQPAVRRRVLVRGIIRWEPV